MVAGAFSQAAQDIASRRLSSLGTGRPHPVPFGPALTPLGMNRSGRRILAPQMRVAMTSGHSTGNANENGNGHSHHANGNGASDGHENESNGNGVSNSAAAFETFLRNGGGILPPGKLPDPHVALFVDFYKSYEGAVLGSGVEGADAEEAKRVMMAIADRVLYLMANKFTFGHLHERIVEPYDYYAFGQNYVRNLIDFQNSVLGHVDRFNQIQAQLDKGHNVMLFANHQTEADPAVWALLLEKTHPRLATDVIYVAGDRVVSDPLCQPFSMGRNLWCVHSKKHLEDDPEKVGDKKRWNFETLRLMKIECQQGGKLVWVAPSGGRDRPTADGRWLPNAYDPEIVKMFYKIPTAPRQGVPLPPVHFYGLAMHTGEMMPPPPVAEKAIGERRITKFVPVGVSVSEELPVTEGLGKGDMKDFGQLAFERTTEEYLAMCAAIDDPSHRQGPFQQPWLPTPVGA